MKPIKDVLMDANIRDLVAIVESVSSPEEARAAVFKYLDKLKKDCPTSGCNHAIDEDTFVCTGYDTTHHMLELTNKGLRATPVKKNPLVVVEFCDAQGDEGHCKYCKAGDYVNREDAFKKIAFCEECGLFFDFRNQKMGYTEDWTS